MFPVSLRNRVHEFCPRSQCLGTDCVITYEAVLGYKYLCNKITYLCNKIMVLPCVLCALRSRIPTSLSLCIIIFVVTLFTIYVKMPHRSSTVVCIPLPTEIIVFCLSRGRYVQTCVLDNSSEQHHSWEAITHSASQEIWYLLTAIVFPPDGSGR
jgi:hypothetical protein